MAKDNRLDTSIAVPPRALSAQERSQQKPTHIRYLVLALVSSLAMITYLDRACFGAAGPMIVKDLGLSGINELKWAFTAFTIAYGLFEIPAGWLGDRWGPRGTLIRIVIAWSIFTALTGLVGLKYGTFVFGGLGTLVAIRFLFGAGEAGAYPNITRVLHDWFPRERWERVQGIVWMSGRIAGGVTPLIWAFLVTGTSWTSPLVSWRGAFLLFGVLGVVWCVVFAWLYRNRPSDHPQVNAAERSLIERDQATHASASTSHSVAVPWKAILTSPTLWALCLMYSLVNYGWIFNISYFPGYVDERFDLPNDSILAAIYKGSPLWIGAIGCLLGGYLVEQGTVLLGDRRRARQLIGISAMALCAASWLGARTFDNVHGFCLCVALAGFGVDLTLGATWASCQDLGQRFTAVTAACMNTIGTAGAAFANWMTGSMVEWQIARANLPESVASNPNSPQLIEAKLEGYDQVFLTYAFVYVLAALLWLAIYPTKPLVSSETEKSHTN